ncbi:hypothetical protein P1P91_05630 [Halomonas piscis]|uniref:Peroxiredoxin n=1 Tax=Halomonas piscis TaxID=3031727 RepID=A0ABY9Z480_9GAMM|nr:hypothetical protein [Halomonas piscis]WNK21154.1 hypothetical protein P1P91_05630 [Halomonas piscis]
MNSSRLTRFFLPLATLALGLGASLASHASSEASAEQGAAEKAMVIVTSDSLQTQGMAMVLSRTMQQQGAELNILLCDQAGDLAIADYQSESALAPKDMKPEGLLQMIMDDGAKVAVCALYLPNSDYQESDLREGVSAAEPGPMAEMMRDPDTKVFHF